MAKIVDPDSLNQTTEVVVGTGSTLKKVCAIILLLFVFLISSTKEINASPSILFSTYFGGSQIDSISKVIRDNSGNIYVVGTTRSSDFPLFNAYNSDFRSGGQAFEAKFSPNGSLLFSTYLADAPSTASGIALDSEGNSIVAINYQNDIYIKKISNDGQHLFFTFRVGGSLRDSVNGIAVDDSGNIYITGATFSSDFPIVNAYQNIFGGDSSGNFVGDAFVTKISSDGSTILYSTYLGGTSSDKANGIAVDGSGNVYVTGATSSSNFPVLNAYDNNLDDGIDLTKSDAFVTKLSNNGSLIYSTYLGGYGFNSSESGTSVTIDNEGNAYLTGTTSSTNFPITTIAVQHSLKGTADSYVTTLSATGNSVLYSTYLGGSGDCTDGGNGIFLDDSKNIYVTGATGCQDFPLINPIQSVVLGDYDAYVTKLASGGGSIDFSTYLGSGVFGVHGGADIGMGITTDNSGNIYVAGRTNSSNFPVFNAYQSVFGGYEGGGDGFLTKIGDNQSPLANAGVGLTVFEGQQVILDGSGSTDPDGASDMINYEWNFGDGNTGNGTATNHIYLDNGAYTATLTVTDTANHTSTDTVQITVNNVAPIVASLSPLSSVLPGVSVITNANFTDPGILDTHMAAFDWGDGMVTQGVITESNGSGIVTGSHTYTSFGAYTITLTITDKDGASSSNSTSVTIFSPTQATQNLTDLVQTFNLQQGIENSLDAKLNNAVSALTDLNQNNNQAAINSLQAFINAVEAQRGNKITNEQANILVQKAEAIINLLL